MCTLFILIKIWRYKIIYYRDKAPRQKKDEAIINENIPYSKMLVIDDEGNKLGLMPKNDAINLAYDKNLDLVVVSPNPKNPVAKIMDYSKYRYEQQKRAKEAKKNQNTVVVQEIKLSPTIDKNDVLTKAKIAKKILNKGNKIKVSLRFRGRMIVHKEIGKEVIESFCDSLKDISAVETPCKLDGKIMFAIIAPIKDKK